MEERPRIVRGRTEIYIPSSAGEIVYVNPVVGPGNYQSVGEKILQSGDRVPVGDEIAPLVREIYCGELKGEKEMTDGRNILQKNRWLWVFNQNLWTPEGLFVVQDRNAEGLSRKLKVENLKQRLVGSSNHKGIEFSSDGEVRFAPKGSYTLGEISADEFEQDGFVIAQYGIEGAKLLAEASSTLPNRPITYGLEIKEGQNPVQSVSALSGDGGRVRVLGDFDDVDYGYAFPVSAPKADKK
jgi:hypothetical protein